MVRNYQYCRYDCYQITLKVNITEEDGCLYSRYGQKLFDIRNTSGKTACSQCNPCRSRDDTRSQCEHKIRDDDKAKIPDAVILDVDVDRCDCTKAVFTLYVKLPCKPKYDFYVYLDRISDILARNDALYVLLSSDFNAVKVAADCPIDFNSLLAKLNTLLTQVGISLESFAPGSCDENMLLTIQTSVTDLITLVTDAGREASKPCSWSNLCFIPQKYKITSSASGVDREIITFLVNPLPHGTVSAGVFKECYQYEVTRVPCRILNDVNGCVPTTIGGTTTVAPPSCPSSCPTDSPSSAGGTTVKFQASTSDDCCNVCFSAPPVLEANVLRLVFPLTKEIRCLVPDFGLPGAALNYSISELSTKVRLVPRSSLSDVAYPALLTFDVKNCTARLEFDNSTLCGPEAINDIGYEQEFGRLGCSKKFNACHRVISPCFEDLALARRIDVMGVHKCTEKVFFSFQVCIVPYKGFCVDVCGCKIPTIISGGCCTKNSFRIQSDCEYSYTFIHKPKCDDDCGKFTTHRRRSHDGTTTTHAATTTTHATTSTTLPP